MLALLGMTAVLDVPDADLGSASRASARRLRAGCWTAAALVLFVVCLRLARNVPVMSDGASNALQAWDMLHGNLLLHGWMLTDLSFYTTELPEYMMTEWLRGLGPDAAHIAAALTYTLLVLGAAVLAQGKATGREAVVRVGLTAAILIAPLGSARGTLLSDPDHVGTQVPLLAAWLVMDRARPGWRVPAVVTLVLAWTQIADPLASYEGVLPIVVVCGIRMYQRRSVSRYELALASGAALSVPAAALALRLIRHAGGFALNPLDTTFTAVQSMSVHLWVTAQSILTLLGADFSGARGLNAATPLLHLVSVVLAGCAVAAVLRRFTSSGLVVQALVVAVFVQLAAFTLGGDNRLGGPHEIAGVLVTGAVLAGRLMAGPLVRGRHLAAACVLLAGYCAVLVHDLAQAPPHDVNRQLAGWLRARHLTYGLASYWNASSVTVDSAGAVQVRPVNITADGALAVVHRDTTASWYDPGRHVASFIVLPGRDAGCSAGTPQRWLAGAQTRFGQPAASYQAAGFVILVWHENLLGQLRQMPSGVC